MDDTVTMLIWRRCNTAEGKSSSGVSRWVQLEARRSVTASFISLMRQASALEQVVPTSPPLRHADAISMVPSCILSGLLMLCEVCLSI